MPISGAKCLAIVGNRGWVHCCRPVNVVVENLFRGMVLIGVFARHLQCFQLRVTESLPANNMLNRSYLAT